MRKDKTLSDKRLRKLRYLKLSNNTNYINAKHIYFLIGCQSNANPSNVSYKWYINNDEAIGEVKNELVSIQ